MSLLITPEELDAYLVAGAPLRVIDVRWRLDEPEGRPAYLDGHLPGAVYVDLERELARHGHPEEGRHPLPHLLDLQSTVRRWGVRSGDRVIAYDDNDGVAAARAWWILRRHSVNVQVLDGGIRSWIRAGRTLERGDRRIPAGDITLTEAESGTVSIDDVGRIPLTGVLVDARAPEQYRGIGHGEYPEAGHIPGAINIPAVSHIASDGRLRTPEEIRATLAANGIHPGVDVVLYCGSGIASTHSALAYAHAGIEARVYPGSWSQWARTPGRPVARGAAPLEHVTST